MEATYFDSQLEFREWLDEHGRKLTEILVGFHNAKSSTKGITYKQALDEALSHGWIDGVRKGVDANRYTIRFTPRKPSSVWSSVNVKRVHELIELGLMKKEGLEAFERRNPEKTAIYAYENRPKVLDEAFEEEFQQNKKAWQYFKSQAPYYQRTAIYWVMGAKQPTTRERRLAILIADSEAERRLARLSGNGTARRNIN